MKQLINRLVSWDVTFYCTDHWKTYASVIPAEKLVMSQAKTGGIERNHVNGSVSEICTLNMIT